MPKGKKHSPEQIVRHLRNAEAALAAGRTDDRPAGVIAELVEMLATILPSSLTAPKL